VPAQALDRVLTDIEIHGKLAKLFEEGNLGNCPVVGENGVYNL